MKRARESLPSFPTLQSVDPIDLRALSDELDLSDLMRRTVISTVDEWAESPVSASSPTSVVNQPPPALNVIPSKAAHMPPGDAGPECPDSPVRLWSSIRRLWHAVFPERERERQTSSQGAVLETACVQSSKIRHTQKPPQTPSRKPRQLSDFFEEDPTETGRPSQPVAKPFTTVPQTPFRKPRQVSDFFEENPADTGQPSQTVVEPFVKAPQNPSRKARQVADVFEGGLTETGRPPQPVATPSREAPLNPFRKPRQVSDFFEEDLTDTGQPSPPLADPFTKAPQNPFRKPGHVSDVFDEDAVETPQPVSKPFKPPKPPSQKPRQVSDVFDGSSMETSQPSQPVPKLFTEVPQNPFRKPRQVTDFFEEDIKETDIDLSLPSDSELLHLCSRITTPTQQSQRRRITGDPAIDRRLAHLESLREQIRQRRQHDKDEDILRKRRRQRLIEEQRRLSSSLRVQRMANVPRNVKLPVPTKRSRLARLKDARAKGGVNSPTGIFEGANGFRA